MKVILVLLDGLGDRSYKTLNGKTPLEAARTPNLDRLAELGGNGLFHASSLGQCLPSETAHHLLLGYDIKNFPGRGLLEAVGEGVPFDNDDVLILTHLSGVVWKHKRPVLVYGRDDINGTFEEMGRLFASVGQYTHEDIRIRLQQTRRNDAVMVLTGPVSPYLSDSDPIIPGKNIGKIVPLCGNPEPKKAEKTARALNRYLSDCFYRLNNSGLQNQNQFLEPPAKFFLVTQRSGRRTDLPPFQKRWGFKGLLIASASVYAGLAHELAIDHQWAKDTHDPGFDLRDRIRRALGNTTHDFIHVHTKVPDEAAHTGDPFFKKEQIARLDRGLTKLVQAVENGEDLLAVVTADHSTPSVSPMIHSGEPVPVVMAGSAVRRDSVCRFSETHAVCGCLGILRGAELMQMILNFSDRGNLYGHQLGPVEKAYIPSDYEPFELS